MTDPNASTTTPPDPNAPPAAAAPPPPPDSSGLPVDSRAPVSAPGGVQPPTVVKPVHRTGLAGLIDEFRDAVAGPAPGRVYQDGDGNKFIQHPDSTGNKWLRVAGTAIRGAAAGAAVGQGPGGKMRAAAAGVDAGDKIVDRRQQQDQQQEEEVKNANLERFNAVKLKHDQAANEFQLQRLRVKATEDDINFAHGLLDREKQLGSADLGVYKDESDLARVKEQHPDFWKSVYENNIVTVPELNDKGERLGIHVFLRTPGVGSQPVDPGTPIKVFTPGKTANDPPTLTDQVPTIPMTHDMVDAYNNAALTKYQKWHADKGEADLKASEVKRNNATADEGPSVVAKNNAEARKADAEAKKADAERKATEGDPAVIDGIGTGQIVPERLGYLLGKKEGQQLLSAVKAKYPDLDTSKLQAYPKLYTDFTSGKSSQQMRNMNTAFQHIEDLRNLNTVSSRMPGSDASHAFESKLTNASAEIANALAKPGATATKDEIAQVKKSLSPFLNRDSAITTQIHSMIEGYKTLRNVWLQGAPSAAYEGQLPDLSPEGKTIIRKYDPQDANAWWGHPVVKDGKTIGYSKDGKTMEPVGSGSVQ